ncbi:MAG: N-acetylmuramoyl-L-alanine amidase [Terrimicrobiaceae bacterium]|nr:N-acetylmuramoyl-L-alanine amidase [Terrimicrobiaceae bacterium]
MKISLLLVLLTVLPALAKVSPLAPRPDWSRLDPYQETITAADFVSLLDRIYAPGDAAAGLIEVTEESAIIRTGPNRPPYVLRFATSNGSTKPLPVYWRPRSALPPLVVGKPLAGLRIAIDPGHLGGPWAKMEERWFRVGNSKPVTEGDMTLLVAKHLVPQLKALGADVFLTRTKPGPVTAQRPGQLRDAALESLGNRDEPATKDSVQKEAERLFYRASEIRKRAKLVNEVFKPDLVLCLHFNAEPWGDEQNPTLVNDNHLHFLITGAWNKSELEFEDQRLDMLVKLLSRTFPEEYAVTKSIAGSMSKATGLPPYVYRGGSVVRVNDHPYIWARNLLANRLFTCPVVYIEPYVMNSKAAFARIQAGDYNGKRVFGGVARKSIYREYADSVVAGLVNYYSQR